MDIQVHFPPPLSDCVLGCEIQSLVVSISFNSLKFLSMGYTLLAHFKCTP